MKKKTKMAASIISIVIIAVIIGLFCVWNYLSDYSTTLNANWGFELPSKSHYSEVYSKDSGVSFHGDGIRYHIFSYKEAEPINKMFDWSNWEEKTIYSSSYQEAVTEWLNEIDVPAEELPNYSECLYWYESKDDNSEIIVLWDSSKNRVYVVESFL